MTWLDDRAKDVLTERTSTGLLRRLIPLAPETAMTVERAGRKLINFSSNDYLGLSRHPALIERASEWTKRWGVGATASRLVCGTFEAHTAIEEKLARLKGTEAALIFNSGYQANTAILPAILDKEMLGREPVIFADRLVHASMHHGVSATGLRQHRYRHNDLDHLESMLKTNVGGAGPRFILTESVFSMDGDRVDVPALARLAERYDATVFLDEAHATGVLGPKGMGLASLAPGRIGLVMGTFSKALGGFGAYLCCSQAVKDYLVNRCPGFIYTTALPPPVLGAMDAALDLLPTLEAERATLHSYAERLRAALRANGLSSLTSDTQIVPVVMGSGKSALSAAQMLEEHGLLGIAIRPPTVPKGTARLRLTLSAAHSTGQIDRLVAALPLLAGFKDA
ncbi:MAG: 8-amino-7-oxononanoate synthase [Alphaproteobacteria bacterium RIFOXYD12_FULL_60_8]|nr:MAG: 8-amino-7-oxononanoate synthase [Alphaproteobacteria bacterium RIFOXYD12_FULL_60_8]